MRSGLATMSRDEIVAAFPKEMNTGSTHRSPDRRTRMSAPNGSIVRCQRSPGLRREHAAGARMVDWASTITDVG